MVRQCDAFLHPAHKHGRTWLQAQIMDSGCIGSVLACGKNKDALLPPRLHSALFLLAETVISAFRSPRVAMGFVSART